MNGTECYRCHTPYDVRKVYVQPKDGQGRVEWLCPDCRCTCDTRGIGGLHRPLCALRSTS